METPSRNMCSTVLIPRTSPWEWAAPVITWIENASAPPGQSGSRLQPLWWRNAKSRGDAGGNEVFGGDVKALYEEIWGEISRQAFKSLLTHSVWSVSCSPGVLVLIRTLWLWCPINGSRRPSGLPPFWNRRELKWWKQTGEKRGKKTQSSVAFSALPQTDLSKPKQLLL